jgi:hypothetical protein
MPQARTISRIHSRKSSRMKRKHDYTSIAYPDLDDCFTLCDCPVPNGKSVSPLLHRHIPNENTAP